MSSADSDDDRADELTERYRAASAVDPARPSDAVRESIFACARTAAVDHATHGLSTAHRRRPAANDSSWRIRAAASVIVAGFAALLAWHWHAPTPVPEQKLNASPSQVAAHNPPATGSAPSVEPSVPSNVERLASAAPAPNADTTRSRQGAGAPAEASSPAHDAAADLRREGASEASSQQAQARIAGGAAGDNATSGSSAIDANRALENPIAGAQVAPSAPAAPPSIQARPSRALAAAASARASVAPNSPLVAAAESGNLKLVDQLLRSGIGTEQTDARGRTALLVATLRGDTAMVRRLLAAGARADVADEDGDTPLAAARRQGPPELARLLERVNHP